MSSDYAFTAACAIKSTWQTTKQVDHKKSGTDAVATAQEESQTIESALQAGDNHDVNERGVATAFTDWAPSSRPSGSGWVYPGSHHNDDSILAFLKEVHEETLEELVQNVKSSAFDNYEPNWQQRSEGVTLLSTWYPTFATEAEWHATNVSWNCTGTLLAVSYGRMDSVAWCHEKGHVTVWQVGQEDETKPYASFDADMYITSVAFHPADPSILAAGAYNGDILVWDVSDQAAGPKTSQGYKEGSREPILRLQWLINPREQEAKLRYVLCSSSADGKVLFWVAANKFAEAFSGYVVHNRKGALVGVQSMSFVTGNARGAQKGVGGGGRMNVPGVENVMLLGLESGDVYRTKPSVRATGKLKEGLPRLEVDNFEPHLGPVQAVDCSPFFRNLFLTASSDGSVRLYTTLEKNHLTAVEPSLESTHYIYSAQFSPARPSVFAAVSRNSNLYIYDLQSSRTKPAVAVEAGLDGAPTLSMAFNHAQPSLLVTGDARGAVRLWKLAGQLQEQTDLERAAVRQVEARATKTGGAAAENAAPAAAGAATGGSSDEEQSAVRALFGFSL
jgi:WD40 repeat protein